MTIAEIYQHAEQIGSMVFSTIDNGEVYSRIAHFNGYDKKGIYFRTMVSKPYYKQLLETESITVCGIKAANTEVGHDENGMATFEPGYTFRLIGKIKNVAFDEIRKKAKKNKSLEMAVKDAERYPAMRDANFIIHKAKVEIYDYDFECISREHKLLRTRTSFGGMSFNKAGPTITEKCISCGKCFRVCSFRAIEKVSGEKAPYKVIPEKCDDCGSCQLGCPVNAIEPSLPF